MGRPKKTTDIKQRTVYVYLPKKELVDEWKAAAKKAGVSVSALVQEAMESRMMQDYLSPSKKTLDERYRESVNKIADLIEENEGLHQKLLRMDTLLSRYEKQLRDLENEKFLSDDRYNGIRRYNRRLIELFKNERYLTEEIILDMLHIPPSDAESIRVIDRQIENLLNYGVIKPSKGGYLWCG